jgi:hypothetical protein
MFPQVHPSTVEEHRRESVDQENGNGMSGGVATHMLFRGGHTQAVMNDCSAPTDPGQLEEERENVDDYQRDRHDWRAGAWSAIVAHRKHGQPRRTSVATRVRRGGNWLPHHWRSGPIYAPDVVAPSLHVIRGMARPFIAPADTRRTRNAAHC